MSEYSKQPPVIDPFDAYRWQQQPLSEEVVQGVVGGFFTKPYRTISEEVAHWALTTSSVALDQAFLEGSHAPQLQGSLSRPIRHMQPSPRERPYRTNTIKEASLPAGHFHGMPGMKWHSIERVRSNNLHPTRDDRYEFFVNSSPSMTFPLFKAIVEAIDRREMEASGYMLDREPRLRRNSAPSRIATFGMWFSVLEQSGDTLHDILQTVAQKRPVAFGDRPTVPFTFPIAPGISMGERCVFTDDYIGQRAVIPELFRTAWRNTAAKHVLLDNISWRSIV